MKFSNIDELRTYRNTLLTESDTWYLNDFPLPVELKAIENQIKCYRTSLRNWPQTETDLDNATVPTKPF
tara:strand:+ start:3828 stop:4034 length:207 start_codon:yes stop_codon:yes gene_type:complete